MVFWENVISFINKEDETWDEKQHNYYDHGHDNYRGEQDEEEDDQLAD